MTDQELIQSYLLLLKSTVEVYIHGTLESSNKKVRNTLQDCLLSTIEMQKDTFQEMVKKNWYLVPNIEKKEIKKVYDKVNS